MKKTTNLISKTVKCLLVFGILFSQLSFPLNVLADEIINQEEAQTAELEEQKEQITTDITSSEEQEESKLLNEITEENTDSTDSSTEEPKEEVPEEETPEETIFEVYPENDFYIVKSNLDTSVSLKQLKLKLENITKVVDKDEVEVTDEEQQLFSGSQITITTEETESTYTLIILGDYDEDGKVTLTDQELLLEMLKEELPEEELNQKLPTLDLNQDQKFDILDVTYPIYNENGSWENTNVALDNLENYLMASSSEVYIGDEVTVEYFIEGFDIDKLVGFSGLLNHDKTLLELTNININGENIDIKEVENGNIVYLLDNYNINGAFIKFTFKALGVGTPSITIENIIASIGGVAANLDTDKVSTSFEIVSGKGGNPEDTDNETTQTVPTQNETSVIPNNAVVQQTKTTTRRVVLSSDNYIKSLTIKGHDIKFDKNTYEYSIGVDSDVTSLELSVILNSSSATYYVEGNNDFKTGENIVSIVVKAENGSTRTYTIKVNKEKKEKVEENDEEEIEETNSSKTVIIILIILVIIGLIYVIFKDDEEDGKVSKKETKKGSKK